MSKRSVVNHAGAPTIRWTFVSYANIIRLARVRFAIETVLPCVRIPITRESGALNLTVATSKEGSGFASPLGGFGGSGIAHASSGLIRFSVHGTGVGKTPAL